MIATNRMILDTSNINADNEQLINDVVGNSFSFFQTIRLGVTDSKIMCIDEVSSYMKSLLGNIVIDTYVSIELRPNGVLVKLHKKPKTFTWIITYHQLKINTKGGVTMIEGNHFLKFKNNEALKSNETFFKRMLRLKVKHKKIGSINQKNKPFYNT